MIFVIFAIITIYFYHSMLLFVGILILLSIFVMLSMLFYLMPHHGSMIILINDYLFIVHDAYMLDAMESVNVMLYGVDL